MVTGHAVPLQPQDLGDPTRFILPTQLRQKQSHQVRRQRIAIPLRLAFVLQSLKPTIQTSYIHHLLYPGNHLDLGLVLDLCVTEKHDKKAHFFHSHSFP
jgi:hypothetical protein